MKRCSVDGCDKPARSKRHMCSAHLSRYHRHGDPHVGGPIRAWKLRDGPRFDGRTECAIEGCGGTIYGRIWCHRHYGRWRTYGDPLGGGPNKPSWTERGRGRYVNKQGYVNVHRPDHPNAYKNGSILEHHLVMSEMLGRPLVQGESVHHKNGVRSDNRPENLELRASMHGPGQRIEDLVAFAHEILARYGHLAQ